MGFLQSLISFIGLISMIIITYTLNNSLFKETDVTQSLGPLCNVNASGLLSPTDNSTSDVRGLLYGPISVQGTSFFAGIAAVVTILIAFVAPKLDMSMESTYEKDSMLLGGEPVVYVSGILYRLSALTTAMLMLMCTILIVPVLQVHQSALKLVEDSTAQKAVMEWA